MTNKQRKIFCATFPKTVKGTNLCGGHNLIEVTEGQGFNTDNDGFYNYANANGLAVTWPSANFALVPVGSQFDMGGAALIRTKHVCYLNYRVLRK